MLALDCALLFLKKARKWKIIPEYISKQVQFVFCCKLNAVFWKCGDAEPCVRVCVPITLVARRLFADSMMQSRLGKGISCTRRATKRLIRVRRVIIVLERQSEQSA